MATKKRLSITSRWALGRRPEGETTGLAHRVVREELLDHVKDVAHANLRAPLAAAAARAHRGHVDGAEAGK